jgi:hypothetical protein
MQHDSKAAALSPSAEMLAPLAAASCRIRVFSYARGSEAKLPLLSEDAAALLARCGSLTTPELCYNVAPYLGTLLSNASLHCLRARGRRLLGSACVLLVSRRLDYANFTERWSINSAQS